MKIQKKKFQMDMPDPKESGMQMLSIPNDARNPTPNGALYRD